MSLERIIEEQKRRMSIYGSTHEQALDNTIFYDFESNPAYRMVSFKGEQIGVHWIEGATKDRENLMNHFLIPKPPMKLKLGDMITDELGVSWLVLIENNFQYNKVFIAPCNHEFTWQDKETLEIRTHPCILTDKTSVYSDGLSKTALIVTGTNQVMVMLPSGDYNDDFNFGDRFIFLNSKKYIFKLNRIDALTTEGTIKLTMGRDEYDPLKDRLDLNIANYIDSGVDTEPEPPEGELQIIGSDEISIWGESSVTYRVNTDKPVEWIILEGNVLTISNSNEGECTITFRDRNVLGFGVLRARLVEDEAVFADKQIEVIF